MLSLHHPIQKWHIILALFTSMQTKYISKRIVFKRDTDSLHLLHFALTIWASRRSNLQNVVPIRGLSHDTIMSRWCLYSKYTVGCLVFTIPLALLSTVKPVLVAPAVVKSIKAIFNEVSIQQVRKNYMRKNYINKNAHCKSKPAPHAEFFTDVLLVCKCVISTT